MYLDPVSLKSQELPSVRGHHLAQQLPLVRITFWWGNFAVLCGGNGVQRKFFAQHPDTVPSISGDTFYTRTTMFHLKRLVCTSNAAVAANGWDILEPACSSQLTAGMLPCMLVRLRPALQKPSGSWKRQTSFSGPVFQAAYGAGIGSEDHVRATLGPPLPVPRRRSSINSRRGSINSAGTPRRPQRQQPSSSSHFNAASFTPDNNSIDSSAPYPIGYRHASVTEPPSPTDTTAPYVDGNAFMRSLGMPPATKTPKFSVYDGDKPPDINTIYEPIGKATGFIHPDSSLLSRNSSNRWSARSTRSMMSNLSVQSAKSGDYVRRRLAPPQSTSPDYQTLVGMQRPSTIGEPTFLRTTNGSVVTGGRSHFTGTSFCDTCLFSCT